MAADKGPREKAVVEAVRKVLKARRGVFFYKATASMVGRAGLPDFICCYRGRFLGLECKRPIGGEVTPVQEACHREIEQAGGLAFVVKSAEEAVAALDMVDDLVDSALDA